MALDCRRLGEGLGPLLPRASPNNATSANPMTFLVYLIVITVFAMFLFYPQ